jgi:hypothetical protein
MALDLIAGAYKQITSSSNCLAIPGTMRGIFVSAASSTPTITVYDSAATNTSTKVVDTFTPVSATWYPLPIAMTAGVYVVISGTVSCTVVCA